jgi:hypothetical protein
MQETDCSHPPSLDSIENNRNKFCGSWTIRGKVEVQSSSVIRFARLGCKKWSCERCGPKRATQLRKAITKKATELGLNRFLTLTLDHNDCSPEQSVMYLRLCWNKFRTYLKRRYGEAVTYIAILEPQASGHAHLHILVDRYIDQRWISRTWQTLGGGHRVDIRVVDVHRISRYLSKYLTKELLRSAYFTKYRRYTTSRDIHLFEKPVRGLWELLKMPLEQVLERIVGDVLDAGCSDAGLVEWFHLRDPSTLQTT